MLYSVFFSPSNGRTLLPLLRSDKARCVFMSFKLSLYLRYPPLFYLLSLSFLSPALERRERKRKRKKRERERVDFHGWALCLSHIRCIVIRAQASTTRKKEKKKEDSRRCVATRKLLSVQVPTSISSFHPLINIISKITL